MKHFIKIAMILLTVISFNSYAETAAVLEPGSRSHNNTLGNYQGDNSTGNGGFNDATGSGDVKYASNSNNKSTSNTKVESSTSGMYGMAGSATTTNLTTSYGQDLCMGSWTAGVSAMGMGISGGSTISDGNCERLRNVKLLNDLGLRDVALSTLCENPAVRAGMKKARPAAYNKLCKMWDEEDDIDDFLNVISMMKETLLSKRMTVKRIVLKKMILKMILKMTMKKMKMMLKSQVDF